MSAPNDRILATTKVRAFARALGFDAVGIARADEPLTVDFERYEAFLDAGYHGTMGYLADAREARARLDEDTILRGAKSVVCLAARYTRENEAEDAPLPKLVARYARGLDYHGFVSRKTRKLAAFLRRLGTSEHPVEARPMCDTAPVLERAWAAKSGLGFVGKNGMLIVPGQGSFVMLGEVVTTLELEPDQPIAERCGSCTRCLDACPTQAFPAPFILDARKCISYWTIEREGPIPESMHAPIGEHLFGCDDCQTVCPFNTAKRKDSSFSPRFEPRPELRDATLEDCLDTASNDARIGSGPMKRVGAEGLARNAAIVLENQRRKRSGIAE
ncbi:MAG: tRNA epoxyqueuosine(34) reductase QueG [Polyangiaceae bacterium]